jgi:hypothetical protein
MRLVGGEAEARGPRLAGLVPGQPAGAEGGDRLGDEIRLEKRQHHMQFAAGIERRLSDQDVRACSEGAERGTWLHPGDELPNRAPQRGGRRRVSLIAEHVPGIDDGRRRHVGKQPIGIEAERLADEAQLPQGPRARDEIARVALDGPRERRLGGGDIAGDQVGFRRGG